ncbi:MAG: hypothetical protein DSZ23_04010 [Thermodesulfatator sp.]|nr:MAG: hypothetical protein DSZ23_04010 [Thermodesulfatator sp.]
MRLCFDLDAALRNRYSGFFTFASGLLNATNRLEHPPEMLLAFQSRYKKLADSLLKDLGNWAVPVSCPLKFRWIEALWNLLPYPSIHTIFGKFDLYHCFHHFMPPRSDVPRLLTVHDLRRYQLPELYKKSRLRPFETAVKRADHFIAVSHATRNDLCRTFDIEPERVDVVHLASSLDIAEMSRDEIGLLRTRLLSRHGLGFKQYIVSFSSKDRRKNINRTVKAFEMALPALPEGTGLVILGQLPESFKIKSTNIFTPGPVDDIIPWLICSRALVFASLYEGFGLPILEGFQAGLPVITSNCSSMPEVAGDAALLVDPYDVRQIRDAIRSVVLDKVATKSLKEAGSKRLKAFSWEKTAASTIKIYEKLTKEPGRWL